MRLEIEAISEDEPGEAWRALFERHIEAYERWFHAAGGPPRPTYLECEKALRHYLPEWVPTWERLCDLAGGGDFASRFLSLYRPPPYVQGCSQVVLDRPEPLLLRNYDYAPELWDGALLRSHWGDRAVLAMTDCLVGALDGVNEDGLAVSLNFGGDPEVGDGFGAPLLVRVALETCSTAAEAARLLRRVPTHMAYNIAMVDRGGNFYTAFTGPNRPTIVRRTQVSTNHQDRVAWPRHAWSTRSLDRERTLHRAVATMEHRTEALLEAMLHPPLHSEEYARGFGTLYTALYRPRDASLELHWPGETWVHSVERADVGVRVIVLPEGKSP